MYIFIKLYLLCKYITLVLIKITVAKKQYEYNIVILDTYSSQYCVSCSKILTSHINFVVPMTFSKDDIQ